jgi:hypothetical protein
MFGICPPLPKRLNTSFLLMPRRIRRSRRGTSRAIKTVSYNNQTTHSFATFAIAATTTPPCRFLLIENKAQGDMKCKNFTLRIAASTSPAPFIFALIYVPNPTVWDTQVLTYGSATVPAQIYSPYQNVIMSGSIPMTAGSPVSFYTRLARILEPTDKIVLICCPIGATDDDYGWSCDVILNYVQTFQ